MRFYSKMSLEIAPSDRSPERNLLCAILLRAWADLDSNHRITQTEAFNWIDLRFSKGEWSFAWLCEKLDLQACQVRKKMLEIPFYQSVQKVQADRYDKKKSIVQSSY